MNVNDSKFKEFVVKMMKRASLNDRSIERYTGPEEMEQFKLAFTHKSLNLDAASNYELAELLGDGIINSIIVNYIVNERFVRKDGKRIVNVGWISKIKTNFISKKGLSQLGMKYGFGDFIRYNPNDKTLIKIKDLSDEQRKNNTIYMSLIEDTVEAFIGTLVQVIDHANDVIGPGYGVATRLVYSLLDEIDVELKYDKIWDAKSRLKELYDKYNRPEYNNQLGVFSTRGRNITFKSINFQEGDKYLWKIIITATINNKKQSIVEKIYRDKNKIEAENAAAEEALKILARRKFYNIPTDPYVRKQQ